MVVLNYNFDPKLLKILGLFYMIEIFLLIHVIFEKKNIYLLNPWNAKF